jgi:DNA-binding beta-propeller fold protein YncE
MRTNSAFVAGLRTLILLAMLPVPLLPCFAEKVVLVAGGGSNTNTGAPLKPTEAQLRAPFGIDSDKAGNLYLVEMTGFRVRKLGRNGMLTVIAGTGTKGDSGDGGSALQAQFNGIHNLAVAPNGDIYLADTWNNRVRKIDARSGNITTIAGNGQKGFSGDGGPATQAQFGGIYCVSLDPKGEQLYLADLDNFRIRVVNLKTLRVRTLAGNGRKGVPKDGVHAETAPLVDPRAVITDGQGRVYILERSGHALRVVEPDGTIKTVVGMGEKGNGGDGGDARQATLNGPKHLCMDLDGNVVIADTENHLIRKYLPKEGKIVRVAGTGEKGTKGIGRPPLEVELNQPHGLYVHPDGTLYIADSSNNRVLKLEK